MYIFALYLLIHKLMKQTILNTLKRSKQITKTYFTQRLKVRKIVTLFKIQ